MNTIIFSHPDSNSFNGAVFKAVREKLESSQSKSTFIDLYEEQFSPVLTREERLTIGQEASKDAQVKRYQEILLSTERLILIFPVWWNAPPAMMKGFFDRVCLREFAYVETSMGIQGKLQNIKSAVVLTTSNAPTFVLKYLMGNTIKKQVIQSMLKGIGVRNCQWRNCGGMANATEEYRKNFIGKAVETL